MQFLIIVKVIMAIILKTLTDERFKLKGKLLQILILKFKAIIILYKLHFAGNKLAIIRR